MLIESGVDLSARDGRISLVLTTRRREKDFLKASRERFRGVFILFRSRDMSAQDTRVPMTSRGYQFLMEELKRLKSVERPKNVREIEEARGHGDLSENAEFHAAKERQSLLDVQIRDIEDKLARAQVIEVSKLSGDRVVFGATVSLADGDTGEKVVYQIVGDIPPSPRYHHRPMKPGRRWYIKSWVIMRRSQRKKNFYQFSR